MTNSDIFRNAHAMARATVREGDDYQVTFAACLKVVRAPKAKKTVKVEFGSVLEWLEWILIVILMVLAIAGLVFVVHIIAAAGHAMAAAAIGFAVIVPIVAHEVADRRHAKRIRAIR